MERRPLLLVLRVQVECVAAEPALRLVVEAREGEQADEVGSAVVGGPVQSALALVDAAKRLYEGPRSFSERTTACTGRVVDRRRVVRRVVRRPRHELGDVLLLLHGGEGLAVLLLGRPPPQLGVPHARRRVRISPRFPWDCM